MRVLIFGRTGQVGRELALAPWPQGSVPALLGRSDCDLADPLAIRRAVLQASPELVINAAAYTAVDRAEAEPEVAGKVNRDAPVAMAEACEELGAALIHLSTDYVFDGSKPGAYTEEDASAPLSVYGRTKAEAETGIRQAVEKHVILRTSWVFAAHGSNFVRTMLRLSGTQPELRIVFDQHGAPTAARDISNSILSVAGAIGQGTKNWGVFHFTSAEPTTWYGFAGAILRGARREAKLVPVTTAEYNTAARRPLNSVLNCARIERAFGIRQPSWRHALADVLAQLPETADAPGIASA